MKGILFLSVLALSATMLVNLAPGAVEKITIRTLAKGAFSGVAEAKQEVIKTQTAWDKFLAVVQKEKISVFFALKSGCLLDLTPTSLHIGLEKDPYFKELSRKENVALLETAAKRAFGRSLTVEIIKGTTLPSSSSSRPLLTPGTKGTLTEQATAPRPQPAGDDPLVKTVLDVLGGEVQTTRSPRLSNEPSQ